MMRILVPTDFSDPSLEAVKCAIALTDLLQSEMLLFHVVEGDPIPRYALGRPPDVPSQWVALMGHIFRDQCPQEPIYRDLCAEAQWKLATLLPRRRPRRFRGVVVVGKVVDEILRVARQQEASHIIIGAQPRTGVRRLFGRSVVDQVLRKAPMPVITIWATDRILPPDLAVLGQAMREASGIPRTAPGESDMRSRSRRQPSALRSLP